MKNIKPVLLSGGSGTRLWPLSRKTYPKQFLSVVGETTLFQQTANRLKTSKELNFGSPICVTNSDFRFMVAEQLAEVGLQDTKILIEPEGRNTAPAVLAAALEAAKSDKEAVLLIAPTDQIISDIDLFHEAVARGLPAVSEGQIVTFGIEPTSPEVGYGYIEVDGIDGLEPVSIKRFVEKPNSETASEMLRQGGFFWNAGIFMARAVNLIEEFKIYCPDLVSHVEAAIRSGENDLDFYRLDPGAWSLCADVSIDYAIMEKSDKLVCVPFPGKWSDLGGWEAVWREMPHSKEGVAGSLGTFDFGCKDTLLRTEDEGQILVGLGLNNIVAVATRDAVLVADRSHVGEVKHVVAELSERGVAQATSLPKDHRPWGWFETLTHGSRFQVKRIFVTPGETLSLQSHHHRSEHWIVVAGTARVTIGEQVKLVAEGESVYIPLGATHRLENPGKVPMILIEVQTGPYLGEDDIVRYEDKYARR